MTASTAEDTLAVHVAERDAVPYDDWVKEERACVLSRPAPAWYTEGLEGTVYGASKGNPSMVFSAEYTSMLDDFYMGVSPNSMVSPTDGGLSMNPSMRGGEGHSGMTSLPVLPLRVIT